MPPVLRPVTERDAPAIHAIYAPVVVETVVSFALHPPSVDQIRWRILETAGRWPWLVCAEEDHVLGYAAAGPDRANRYRVQTAYDWSAEVSVYVHEVARRRGVARALYTSLLGALRQQGFVNVFASITLPNSSSVALHEAMGFKPVGIFRGEGFKHGQWHDVGWWQLQLRDRPINPVRPKDFDELRALPVWEDLLRAGSALLRF